MHLDDLIMLDGSVYTGKPSIALSNTLYGLRSWRRALKSDARDLLRSDNPGEIPLSGRDTGEPGPGGTFSVSPERLIAWRRVVQETEKLPPLLAAAIAWDAWLCLLPDINGAWRASLISALVMRARGLTSALLLPINLGQRHAKFQRHDGLTAKERIAGYVIWVHTACQLALKEFHRVRLADEMLHLSIKGHQKNSHLPELVDLFLQVPLVSVSLAVKKLGITKQSVIAMLPELGSHIREVTGRKRCRVWSIN